MTSDLDRHKQLVRRLADDAINGENTSVLDEVCTARFAAELREWFAPFRAGFPDWRQEIYELVAEGETVVAQCRCRGTTPASGSGCRPPGGRWRWTRSGFFTVLGPSRPDVEPRGHVVSAPTAGNGSTSDRGGGCERTYLAARDTGSRPLCASTNSSFR